MRGELTKFEAWKFHWVNDISGSWLCFAASSAICIVSLTTHLVQQNLDLGHMQWTLQPAILVLTLGLWTLDSLGDSCESTVVYD